MRCLTSYIPNVVLRFYHWLFAVLAAFVYRSPSNRCIVIGVTGTNGKSSTVIMIAQMLSALGKRVGYTATAGFSIAGKEVKNNIKMTMPGRWYLQKMLRQMVNAQCEYVIVETSSQGIEQFRHSGINYDIVTYTNLTPEHIEAHGGFEEYKQAKGRLFAHLTKKLHKTIHGKLVEKISVIPADDPYAHYFAGFPADKKVTYAKSGKSCKEHIVIKDKKVTKKGLEIMVQDESMNIPYLATFQQKNAKSALAVLYALGFSLKEIQSALQALEPIAGRFERVDEGQDFIVIVDYAYEPYALEALFDSIALLKPKRVIGVHGSAGGGRDKARRHKIGKLAALREDIIIVTNEDPYDENPRKIIEQVARGAEDSGAQIGIDLFLVNNRDAAIEKAIGFAKKGDIVIITGKGSETVMAVEGGKLVPMDDRKSARRALKKKQSYENR